jgi:hypothetical protein
MKMFRAMFDDIEEKEITRKTVLCVFYILNGEERKEKIEGSYWYWSDTKQEAKDWIIRKIEGEILRAESNVKYLQQKKYKIEKL